MAKKTAKGGKKKGASRSGSRRSSWSSSTLERFATTYVMCPVHRLRYPKGAQCPECAE